jgi:hypothetical protein
MTAALALVLAACARDEPASGGTAPTTTAPTGVTAPTGPTATTGPTAPTGPTAEPPTEAELEDGRHFGFVEAVDVAGATIEFDLAYFLTGEDANEAAAERGLETPVPNDYFIVNDNPRLRTLALAPDLELALLDWANCCDEFFQGDLEAFAAAIDSGEQVTVGDDVYQGVASPYWLTVEGGVVVRIEEQYLP